MDMHDGNSLQAARSLRLALLTICSLLLLLAFPLPTAHAAGTTRFVKPSAAGAADCSNWANACTLQTALATAVSPDSIWVQQGTYKPTTGTDPAATFNLKSGVAVYGGFAGTETALSQRNWTTNVTTLSGDLGTAHSSHVVTADGTDSMTLLDGFIITGGEVVGKVGGGILIFHNGSLTIANCTITNNSADSGGGLYQEGSGRVVIADSIIQLNTASAGISGNGGGLFVGGDVALTNTQVLSNTAGGYGGGLTNFSGRTDLNGGLFSNNRSLGSNGGAVNVNNGISITNTQFISNTSSDSGGAVLQWSMGQPVTITGARFERNTSKSTGGGAYVRSPVTITNSIFVTNTVESGLGDALGGGVYAGNTVQVLGSTFSGNAAKCSGCSSPSGGGLYASLAGTIVNSTFDGNDAWMGGGAHGAESISVTGSTFKNNTGGQGGGIYAATALATGSVFLNNRADLHGGGVWASNITLSGARMIGNAARYGGALSVENSLDAANVLFADNSGVNGAVIRSGTSSTLRHTTIVSATASSTPAIQVPFGTLAVTNTIVSNYATAIQQLGGNIIVDYDLFSTATPVQSSGGTQNLGTHNQIGVDPKFANAAAGDYHLTASSPAVDSGTNVGVTIDLDGLPRPLFHGYDMGAFEFGSLMYLPLLRR